MKKASIIACSLLSTASAWWNNGHMITAKIAYDYLSEHNPDVLSKAEGILKPIQMFNRNEKNHSFVESATFADDAMRSGLGWQFNWHFNDQPYRDHYDGPIPPNEKFNVSWSIDYMHKALKGPREDDGKGVSWALGDAFNLRLLIHYTGDMHQPLHTTTRFSKELPTGDEGGNLFPLLEKDEINELHALWDSGVYEYDQDFPRPLSEDSWAALHDIASKLRQEHPIEGEDIQELLKRPESEWALEGNKLAVDFVYTIKENSLPTDEYVFEGQKIVRHQLALGGYRLANLLIDIYGSEKPSTVSE